MRSNPVYSPWNRRPPASVKEIPRVCLTMRVKNLAHAYWQDGQKELARRYAAQALALLDSHAAPASSWSDTDERRGEIRKDLQNLIKHFESTAEFTPAALPQG